MKPSRIADLLRRILHVIDTTDPEADVYLDSGADSIDLLLELDEEIRDAVFEITGTYPVTRKTEYDFDASGSVL